MAKIKQISARQILNGKGQPAVETTVVTTDGAIGTASAPSGTSVGRYEAHEIIDNDDKAYSGLSVRNAIMNIEEIITPSILGMEVTKQQEIDRKMIQIDGTHNKSRLGSNATLSVSMAVAKAASRSSVLPLFLYLREFIKKENQSLKIPTPLFNVINGGKHAEGNLDFQEFLVIPATSKPFNQALELGTSVYFSLKKLLKSNNFSTLLGDEGGFGPNLSTNMDAFALLQQAIEASNQRLGFDIFLGLDAAANSFYADGKYRIKDKSSEMSSKDLVSYYDTINKSYHLLYLEDGLSEDDWEGWSELYTSLSKDTLIVGDDLTATNPFRLQTALDKKSITGIIIKPNQIGTVIEAIAVVEIARQAGLKIIVSHRSGETDDDFIADFAVAVSADYAKFGAPARGERVAKYNRLLQIERQIKSL